MARAQRHENANTRPNLIFATRGAGGERREQHALRTDFAGLSLLPALLIAVHRRVYLAFMLSLLAGRLHVSTPSCCLQARWASFDKLPAGTQENPFVKARR